MAHEDRFSFWAASCERSPCSHAITNTVTLTRVGTTASNYTASVKTTVSGR